MLPTYSLPYDKAGGERRPHRAGAEVAGLRRAGAVFVSLYFEEVDTAGHDLAQTRRSSPRRRALDTALGELVAGVHGLGLDDRTTIVIV